MLVEDLIRTKTTKLDLFRINERKSFMRYTIDKGKCFGQEFSRVDLERASLNLMSLAESIREHLADTCPSCNGSREGCAYAVCAGK